jgi:hypothetical protein
LTFSGVGFTRVADLASHNPCLRKVHLSRRMWNREDRILKCVLAAVRHSLFDILSFLSVAIKSL